MIAGARPRPTEQLASLKAVAQAMAGVPALATAERLAARQAAFEARPRAIMSAGQALDRQRELQANS